MKNKISQIKKGFTLIEMLMVLAIFTILTSVVMYNYAEFNSKTIMSNMAYEIALTVRQAQVYSLGVRGQVGAGSFDNRYGVYFNTSNGGKEFAFFFDRKPAGAEEVPNGWCDGDAGEPNCLACISGGESECLEKVALTRDIYISKLCLSNGIDPIDQGGNCTETTNEEDVSITFDRPNPDAKIRVDSDEEYSNKNIGIVVKNSFGNQRAVIIRSTGQISVINLNNSI